MALRTLIAAFATTTVWPGLRIEWTTGWARHSLPDTRHVDGVRLLVLDKQGRLVDAVDGETLIAVLVKVVERYRVTTARRRGSFLNTKARTR